jgi:phage repressor protein C with HTH and peptisase S24 domain
MIDLQRFRRDFKIKQKEIQEYLGVSQSYISQIEGFEKPLTKQLYELLLIKYGDVLKKYEVEINPPESNIQSKGVPYYDIDVTASIIASFDDVKEIPEFFVDFKPFNDCTAYIQVFGNSMYPEYNSGEVIAIKQLKNIDIIQWGEAYLVITSEEANNMKTIKLVYPHEEPGKIILRSSNPDYKGDTVINKSSILSMYIIKGKITRKHL